MLCQFSSEKWVPNNIAYVHVLCNFGTNFSARYVGSQKGEVSTSDLYFHHRLLALAVLLFSDGSRTFIQFLGDELLADGR